MSSPRDVNVAFSSDMPTEVGANSLVLDNSVMMRWLFDDGSPADQRYAKKTLAHIETASVHVFVPHLWVYEAAFVVGYYSNQQALDRQLCMYNLNFLFDVCTVVAAKDKPAAVFEFAATHSLSAYDASYLMLADSLGCSVASLDKKMRKAARKINRPVFN